MGILDNLEAYMDIEDDIEEVDEDVD